MKATSLPMAEKLSGFRWVVLAFILVVQLELKAIMFAPAALASPIIMSLQLTRTGFGLIMSALNITIMISVALGSVLVDRAGLKRGLLCGLAVAALGTALQLRVPGLSFFVFTRVLQGIGIAVSLPVLGGLIMSWFSRRERPYINTIVVAFGFLGTASAMIGTAELFRLFGSSWRIALGCYAVSLIVTAIA